MEKYFVLYNPLSNNKRGEKETNQLKSLLPDAELTFFDQTAIKDKAAFFETIPEDTCVIVSGGDGTIHNFINGISGIDIKRDVYYFASGTGNDFLNDIKGEKGKLVLVNKYIQNLPVVEVKGKKYKFLNNVGFGIDGYCCEEGDRQRASGAKKINYTAIALKGLLGGYKKVRATIKIDGFTKSYKNVWLAPTMNGRFIGGGMMACPDQDRLNAENTVSLMVMHHPFNLKILTIFPTIFKGTHVKYKKIVEQFKGYEIEVEFDKPTALQIDGETITEVLSYKVWATPEYRKAAIRDLETV